MDRFREFDLWKIAWSSVRGQQVPSSVPKFRPGSKFRPPSEQVPSMPEAGRNLIPA